MVSSLDGPETARARRERTSGRSATRRLAFGRLAFGRLAPGRHAVATLRGFGPAHLLLAATMSAFAVFYIVHLSWMHDRFWTTGYDLGIFDQATWLIANGESFITIRGLDFWGHHLNPGLYLLAPFYWLGAGPRFLNAAMVLAYVAGAPAVFRIAVHHLRNEWLALALAVAYLLQTSGQWILHETFHPEVMAIAPMLFAYLAHLEGRGRAYWLWLALAASWKEDISITIVFVGVVLMLRGHRRRGALTTVLALAYYFFCTKVVIPHYTPVGPFYSEFLGDLGGTPLELAKNAVIHPTRFTDQFQEAQWYRYPRDLAQPYAFTSFLSWPGLVIAFPQIVLNLLTKHSYAWSIRWHYVSMPTFGFTIAAIEGIANLRRLLDRVRHDARRLASRTAVGCALVIVAVGAAAPDHLLAAIFASAAVGLVVAVTIARPERVPEAIAAVVATCAVTMSAMWAPSYGWRYDDPGMWPRTESPHLEVLRDAVRMVPDGATISVSYNFSTHLGHREHIYEFPNPWRNSYWGVDQRLPGGRITAWPAAHDPDTIDWLAVDTGTLGPESQALLRDIVATGQWRVLLDRENVLVAQRIR